LAGRAAFPAMPSVRSAPPCPLCPPGSSARGQSARRPRSAWRLVCLSSGSWPPSAGPRKPALAPGCQAARPSAQEPEGCRAWPLWAGGTGGAGMQAALCSERATPGGGSAGSALLRRAPTSPPGRRRAVPSAALPPQAGHAGASRPGGRMASPRAARGKPTTSPGGGPRAPRASAHRSARAECRGPSGSAAGWLEDARAWRPWRSNSGLPSASIAHGPRPAGDFRRAGRPRAHGIIFVSGSRSHSAGHALLVRTEWPGHLRGFHTKRLIDAGDGYSTTTQQGIRCMRTVGLLEAG
jgi:hypothetical protein